MHPCRDGEQFAMATGQGGPSSQEEQELYINCLESLAATFAVPVSVLLHLNNQTAVAYVNNLQGTVSPQLTRLAKDL